MVINYLVYNALYYKLVTSKSKIFIIFYLYLLSKNQKFLDWHWLCELKKED